MSKKKLILIFIVAFLIGLFVANPVFSFLGIPTSDEIIKFIFG